LVETELSYAVTGEIEMQELDVGKIKGGDREELKELFEILLPRIRLLARRSFARASYADVDDLLQEAIIRIYSNIHKFDPNRGDFLAWCHAVARNVMFEYWRRKEPVAQVSLDIDEIDTEKLPQSKRVQENIDATRVLEEAIATLPDDQIEIVRKHMEGQSFEEIAKELSLSIATVYRKYKQALKMIQSLVLAEPKK
jgi:RNA polymerase sigma-70 factor, ECF subfamily